MMILVFEYYDRSGSKCEYKTKALSYEEGQARFGVFQMRKKLNKKFWQVWKIVDRKRVNVHE